MALPTRIQMPATARKGQIVEIKTIVQHEMETGYRRDDRGGAVPRNILTRFTVTYGGEEVFRSDLFPGVAANPYFAFTTVATQTGEMVFTWVDQHGQTTVERRTLTVA